jgi:arylsulfatase A-like enzyme/Tfp pilus assembly protein PilF
MPRTGAWATGALLLFVYSFASQALVGHRDSRDKTNVVLITVDTLRADHLGCYGNRASSTPTIDALAGEGYLFSRAYAQVPLTLPSHYSILSGTFPFHHGVRDNSVGRPNGPPLVSEVLHRNGYRTAAFVGSFILDSRFGLDRGFDYYYDDFDLPPHGGTDLSHVERPAGEVVKEALRWLASGDAPFFAWVHLFDPHDPYSPPEPYKSRFASSPYDGEISYVDQEIGTLLKSLQERGLLDETHIILTSDHGEGLGDHGEFTHGLFLYDSTIHVPLIVRLANQRTPGRRIEEVVRSIDIAPTILQLVGIQPAAVMQGTSLAGLLFTGVNAEGRGRVEDNRLAYSETFYPMTQFGWSPLAAIQDSRYKFVDAPRPELYDQITDPGEKHNLYYQRSALASQLRDTLQSQVAKYSASAPPRGSRAADPETIQLLQSLGYVAGASQEVAALKAPALHRADPKEKVVVYARVFQALADSNRGHAASAARLLEAILEEDPGIVSARLLLGAQYERLGDFSRAAQQYAKALAEQSDNALASFNLGQVCAKEGRPDEAVSWYRQTLRVDPAFTPAHLGLGAIYRTRKDWPNALAEFRAALAEEPRNYTAHYNLAGIYGVNNQLDLALAHARQAVGFAPKPVEAYNLLGWILFLGKDMGEAEAAFAKGVELDPRSATLLTNLARVYVETGRSEKARTTLKRVLNIDPHSEIARRLLAQLDRPMRDKP